MKALLIAANAILALLTVHAAFTVLRSDAPALELKSDRNRTAKTAKAGKSAPEKRPENTAESRSSAEAGRIIAGRNIFDPARCPNAIGSRGMRSGNGNSGGMSLVGVYRVDGAEGAVILFKNTGTRRTAGAGAAGGLRINNLAISPLGAGSAASGNRTAAVQQQYFRKGDVLPNGYTLSQVDPAAVTLTRGGSQMVLALAPASENAAKGSARSRTANPMQQMLQLMQRSVNMQQAQQMNMMRMMRNQQQPASGSATRSTNTRSR